MNEPKASEKKLTDAVEAVNALFEPEDAATPEITRGERVITKWEKNSAVPLALLALAYLALWAIQVLADLTPFEFELVEVGILVIWGCFIIDFSVRLFLHQDRKKFLKNNAIELLALVVPVFRAFRMLRVITAVGILTRVVQSLQARVNLYIAIVLPMIVFAGSLGVFEAERNAPNATITSFGNAVWWTIVTVFTVGYGDLAPVTIEGRAIAVIMMLSGVALISVVTVNLATYFLRNADLSAWRRF
jgi:voltage-gated potassium channel